MEIFEIENLTFTYPGAGAPAIKNLSLTVNEGDYLVICGYSGCGKTTLLRRLKPRIAPVGKTEGKILYRGEPLDGLTARAAAAEIGYVAQSPENAAVTDKVWHELAFGLESLGAPTPEIRRRVAETASFFGIGELFDKKTAELSGGQKQLVNLAAVMVMRPKALLLDEPAAQLDPIASAEFLNAVKKLNRELGTTVILADHRPEETLADANRAAVMQNGEFVCVGAPAEVGERLKRENHGMFAAMPAAARIWGGLSADAECPISPAEGREFLRGYISEHPVRPVAEKPRREFTGEPVVSATEIFFRYGKDSPDILKNFSLSARSGEMLCVLGENGGGKSTALRVLCGVLKPYRGTASVKGKIAMMPQDPRTLFVKRTVIDDLTDAAGETYPQKERAAAETDRVLSLCRLEHLKYRHPYDLSGGERQRAALAKLLLIRPDVLLLDEPSKGMDAPFKREFAAILENLRNDGVCIIAVSHDMDFCAEYADRCALLFNGGIVCDEPSREFFAGNRYYTTAAAHITDGILPGAVTAGDVLRALGADEPEPAPEPPADLAPEPLREEKPRLPLWRKICGAVSAVLAAAVMFYAAKKENLAEMTGSGGITASGWKQLALYGIFSVLLILTFALTARRPKKRKADERREKRRRFTARTAVSVVIVLLTVPATLFAGLRFLGRDAYYAVAFAVALESMLPFVLVFEGGKPRAREIAVIAVLCALAVAGRAVFFMFPQFKPVLAVTVIAGVALGGETGFLVGSVSMLVSNILFSQGPWTPWQMLATGIIGFLAGVLYSGGILRRSRVALSVFGAVCALFIYGGIMNFSSALIWSPQSLNKNILFGYYITGFPMDCVYAAATALFLWVLSEPMLEKLDRIKLKYGLLER